MEGKLEKKRTGVLYLLTIFWILLTTILLLSALYFNWQKEQSRVQQALFVASSEISNHLADFINDIQKAVYSIPVLSKGLQQCTPELKSGLGATVFNHPMISAIAIKDRANKVVCSTLIDNAAITYKPRQDGLIGPVKFFADDNPAFIIQQQLGPYTIDVFLLQTVLESTLRTYSPYIQTVALYDQKEHRVVLQINYDLQTGKWARPTATDWLSQEQLKRERAKIYRYYLDDMSDYQLILVTNPKVVYERTIWYEIFSVALVLFGSILLYFYLRKLLTQRFSLIRAIQSAIKHESFFPEYQPIFDAFTGQYTGVEVLMRWRMSDKEIIMPDIFVEEAEQSGLIVPITLLVIEKAFRECRNILKTNPKFHLGFNLCFTHFTHAHFFEKFEALRVKYNIPPQHILLEITEREIISHSDTPIAEQMQSLRTQGYSMAIDDFGTGHASINYLRHLPFDYLKIDKIFVSAIGSGAITEALNQSIIQMAKNLKLHIIAEGVESKQQVDYLKKQGVQFIQGWYFAKAMPINHLASFLKGANRE